MCLKENDDGYKRGFRGEGRKEGMAMLYYSISYFLSKKEIKKYNVPVAVSCVDKRIDSEHNLSAPPMESVF